MHIPRWKMTPSDEFQECLSPVIVILSFLQLVNVPFLQQQLLFLHNQKGPTNSACISVDADFSLTNISDHWDLGKTAAPHECKVSAWNQNYRTQNRITKFPKAKTFQALSEAQNKEQHSYKQERSRRLFSTVLSFNWILFRNKQPPLKKPTPQPSNKPYIIKHVKKKIKVKWRKYKNLPKTPTKQTQQAVYSEKDLQIMLLGTCKVVFKALSSLLPKRTPKL